MEQQSQTKGGEQQQDQQPEHERDPDAPRIYVASLSDYNDGRLYGTWLDAARDPEELHDAVHGMLARAPTPGAEEFAIHDYENFGPLHLSEYESLETVSRIATGIAEHGPAFAHFAALVGTTDSGELTGFEDAYLGHFESVQAYAEELLDDLGYEDLIDRLLPKHIRAYVHIDVEGFARDLSSRGTSRPVRAREGSMSLTRPGDQDRCGMDHRVMRFRISPGTMGFWTWRAQMDKDQAKSFGELIRRRRQELGLSTHDLGKLVGTRNSTIMRIEQGAFAAPRPDKLARIADALHLNLADVYAKAGYLVPTELPGFHAYLPARYRELPQDAVDELTHLFEDLVTRHKLDVDPVPASEGEASEAIAEGAS